MPNKKSDRPAYLIKRLGNDYHVYVNDAPEGTPTGRKAGSFAEGQKIISQLEERDRARERSKEQKKSQESGSGKQVSSQGTRLSPPSQAPPARKNTAVSVDSSRSRLRGDDSKAPNLEPLKRYKPDASSTAPTLDAAVSPQPIKTFKSTMRRCSPEKSDKAKRLFQFLRELTMLRSKTIRTLEKYSTVIWLNDVPKLPGCISVYEIPEDERSDLLLRIEQPKLDEPPEPPDSVALWIDREQLENCECDSPKLKPRVTITNDHSGNDGQTIIGYEYIEDKPQVTAKWNEYVSKEWQPWAALTRQDRTVQTAYEQVFDIHQRTQKLAEEYELLLAVGLLSWVTPSGQTVCRHLLTARASVTFDMHSGVVEITAPQEGLSFVLEQDMLELAERPANHHRGTLERLLAAVNSNPFSGQKFDAFLQSWVNATSSRGAYNREPTTVLPEENPKVSFSPAVILRKRTERSLIRILGEIIDSIEATCELPLGVERLVSIIDDADFDLDDGGDSVHLKDNEIYFPLSANADQREIAEQLRHRQGILVQGPPGTGKSHTIANLVCHLLAMGKRILVTSHTPRALSVLRDKFPEEMKALCVSVIGEDGAAARRALEESVSGITSKRNRFNKLQNKRIISDLRAKLELLRQTEARSLNALRSIRESDTYMHPVRFGGYKGTTQSIAQRLSSESEKYSWLNIVPSETEEPPLSNDEAVELLGLFRSIPDQIAEELRKSIVELTEIPSPEQFTESVTQYKALTESSVNITDLKQHPAFAASSKLDECERRELTDKLGDFTNTLQRILNRREVWVKRAVLEIVSDRDRTWRKLLSVSKESLSHIGSDNDWLLSCKITGLDGKDLSLVKIQATDLLEHLEQNGSLGLFWRFRPKPVQEAFYLVKNTRVDGRLADNPETLKKLIKWLDVHTSLEVLKTTWSGIADFDVGSVVVQIAAIEDCCEPLEEGILMHDKMQGLREIFRAIPGLVEPQWDDLEQVVRFLDVLSAGQIEERLQHIGSELQQLQAKLIVAASNPKAHLVMSELLRAIELHDCDLYHVGYKALKSLHEGRKLLERRTRLSLTLNASASALISDIESSSSDSKWDERLADFSQAWNWARANAWIKHSSSPEAQGKASAQLAAAQAEIKEALGSLAAALAWDHTFERLTDAEHSYLIAWEMAMRRIGKGTGKYAEQHRKKAREHMEQCRSSIPAWIMPIHKVVETTRLGGEPFDVVIVDEASQSGPEALVLLYFAKQIIVVGDDKQISPDFVGLNQQDVNALREQFLKDIPFSDALGVEHSFFDQAKIRYRGTIRLKEHFRCMPEIIQFSNNLCYADDPLIPLRQFGAGRISPVLKTQYVEGGYIDDSSSKAVNKPEAEAIIAQIKKCCEDPAYDGKTIGVISLLNTSEQAEYIETRFKTGNILTKEEMERRKLRVGDSYVFQGDERDIIFMSMVAAPPSDGRRLSAMAMARDERRFNVAASRARDQAWLFHSVSLSDLNPKCIRFNLLSYYSNPQIVTTEVGDTDVQSLKQLFEKASHSSDSPPKPFDSWFEVDVFLRIVARGYRVLPQYQLNGYFIDMVVEGMKGRLAVECDGDAWHGPERYDADAARERDIERCGMQFWRVRGSVFYLDKDKALESLWERLEELKIFPTSADAIAS